MPTIEHLKTKAQILAAGRNHGPFIWGPTHRTLTAYGQSASARCTVCEKTMNVLTHPEANEADIAGEAVAVYCTPGNAGTTEVVTSQLVTDTLRNPASVCYEGILEIDHGRGVIYFHHSLNGTTKLRICSLPKPIPDDPELLDITHMYGASWGNDVASQSTEQKLGKLEKQIIKLAKDNNWSVEHVAQSLMARMKNEGMR